MYSFPVDRENLIGVRCPQSVVDLVAGKTASEIQNELVSRLPEFESNGFSKFKEQFGKLTPSGMVLHQKDFYLVYRGAILSPRPRGDWSFYYPLNRVDSQVHFPREFGHELRAFLSSFAGSKEFLDRGRGFLLKPEKAVNFVSDERAQDLRGKHVVFHAGNGDLLTIDRDGNADWVVMETQQIVKVGKLTDFASVAFGALTVSGIDFWGFDAAKKQKKAGQ